MDIFDFQWALDTAGYDIVDGVIRGRGGRMQYYEASRVRPPIHHQFADLNYDPRLDQERYGHRLDVSDDKLAAMSSDEFDDALSPPSLDGAVLRFVNVFGLLGNA